MVYGKIIKVKMLDKEDLILSAINEIWCNAKISGNVRRHENAEISSDRIYCDYCGNKILKKAKFCSYCGKENQYRENE